MQERVDVYLKTVERLEPGIHAIDAGFAHASVAISLKRIADAMLETNRVLSCIGEALEVQANALEAKGQVTKNTQDWATIRLLELLELQNKTIIDRPSFSEWQKLCDIAGEALGRLGARSSF